MLGTIHIHYFIIIAYVVSLKILKQIFTIIFASITMNPFNLKETSTIYNYVSDAILVKGNSKMTKTCVL